MNYLIKYSTDANLWFYVGEDTGHSNCYFLYNPDKVDDCMAIDVNDQLKLQQLNCVSFSFGFNLSEFKQL